ncbi:hypothetical protein CMO86_10220 [Candidatus Woesearchaeota archaeon]|nr:hypothetical protein [Candidatus Woesearchaeota archaeon]
MEGLRPHDATIATIGADDVGNLRPGALTGRHKPGRRSAGGRSLTADEHLSIVIRKASYPYAGAIIDGGGGGVDHRGSFELCLSYRMMGQKATN